MGFCGSRFSSYYCRGRRSDPANRGKVMAFYSLIGFLGGSIGPVTFGYMLDIGGGETTALGWRLGFFTLPSGMPRTDCNLFQSS